MTQVKLPKVDMDFLMDCEFLSRKSPDPSTKCGAKIVCSMGRVISEGYNRFPEEIAGTKAMYDNRETKYERIIHCEMLALIHAGVPVVGCTLYTWPMLSCPRCTVHMLEAGITRFIAARLPRDKQERWLLALQRSKAMIEEAQCSWTEVDVRTGLVHEAYNAVFEVPDFRDPVNE